MDINFLLVCEGPTDYPIINAVAKSLSDTNKSYKFDMLAPQIDATSGTAERFGWRNVLHWCRSNHNNIQFLLDFKGAKAMFIQMDTDIASQINSNFRRDGLSARDCCEGQLNACLGAVATTTTCQYILPTLKTETWLLAIHDETSNPDVIREPIEDYESISDVDGLLIRLGYARNKNKLRKNSRLYIQHGENLARNLSVARVRCAELDRICRLIVSF